MNISETIIIDAVFYQLHKGGIGRLWLSLLDEWKKTGFADQVLLLDRDGTLPPVSGVRTCRIPAFTYDGCHNDQQLLQSICDQEKAALFASTYYTTPITTPSFFMAYDMVPERVGMDLTKPQWVQKHRAIRKADCFCAISQSTAHDLHHFFPQIHLDDITVAYCGVDRTLFRPVSTDEQVRFFHDNGIQKPYFVFIGRRDLAYKNATLFFTALSGMPNKESYEVVCIGGSSELEPLFKELTAGMKVHLLHIDDDCLPSVLGGALALVYPSFYEGFGLPIAEAMACHCPVITCYNSSLPEVAGDAALYVPENAPDALIQALHQVQTPAVRNRMTTLGTQQSIRFSWERMAETVSSVMLRSIRKQHMSRLSPQSTELPRITLVVPSLNQGKYIEKTITSVLEQKYPNLEFFIIDGGSTDETLEIIRKYQSQIDWWVSEPDRGQADAINKGLARATGAIFNWLNSDDYLEPEALFRVAKAYRKNPTASAWVGAAKRLHENGFLHYISYPNGLYSEHILNNFNARTFYQPACFMSTSILHRLGGLKDLHYCMDYEVYIRLAEQGPFVRGEGIWCTALAQPDAKTVKNPGACWIEHAAVLRKHGSAQAADNLVSRAKTGVFNYVMPDIIQEQISKTVLSAPFAEIPFTFHTRRTVCILGDFTQQFRTALLERLGGGLKTVLERFSNVTFELYGPGGNQVPALSSCPHYAWCGDIPKQPDYSRYNSLILLDPAPSKWFAVLKDFRRHGVPVLCSTDLSEQLNIREGENGFTASDTITFAFKAVQLLLDPAVWGNMSSQNLIESVQQGILHNAGQDILNPPRILFYFFKNVHIPILKPIYEACKRLCPEAEIGFACMPHAPEMRAGFLPEELAIIHNIGEKVYPTPQEFRPDITFIADSVYPWVQNCGKLVHVGHGVLSKGQYYTDTAIARREEQADLVCVPGEYHAEVMRRIISKPVVATGMAKLDPLFSGAMTREGELGRLNLPAHFRYVLFAPTFNDELSAIPHFRDQIVEVLPNSHTALLIKLHGSTKAEYKELYRHLAKRHPRVYYCDDLDITPFLAIADLMISDVSSSMMEFAALDKPLVLFDSPLWSSYPNYNPADIEFTWRNIGFQVKNLEEMKTAVSYMLYNPRYLAVQRRCYTDRLFANKHDGRGAERIVQQALKMFETSVQKKQIG